MEQKTFSVSDSCFVLVVVSLKSVFFVSIHCPTTAIYRGDIGDIEVISR